MKYTLKYNKKKDTFSVISFSNTIQDWFRVTRWQNMAATEKKALIFILKKTPIRL